MPLKLFLCFECRGGFPLISADRLFFLSIPVVLLFLFLFVFFVTFRKFYFVLICV